MLKYISVKNWEKFQHYKERTPPWIKLHRDLLRDYEFQYLQDASKLHLMLIWLLASQMGNKIPADINFIKKQIGVTGDVSLKELIDKGFIYDASSALADCKQSAIGETETEAYREETEEEEDILAPQQNDLEIAVEIYNEMANSVGLPRCQLLNDQRKRSLAARLKEAGGMDGWRTACDLVGRSDFLTGKKTDWKASFDFMLQKKSFTKIMEGQYENFTPKKTDVFAQRIENIKKTIGV